MDLGTFLMPCHPPEQLAISDDCADTPGPWRRSLELLAGEVVPQLAALVPGATAARA